MVMRKGPQVAAALSAGESVTDVAARFGIKPCTVYSHKHKYGVTEKPRGRFKDEVPQMYRDGLSTLQIAKLARMCHKAVAARLRAAGLTAKDRGVNTIEFWREQLAKSELIG